MGICIETINIYPRMWLLMTTKTLWWIQNFLFSIELGDSLVWSCKTTAHTLTIMGKRVLILGNWPWDCFSKRLKRKGNERWRKQSCRKRLPIKFFMHLSLLLFIHEVLNLVFPSSISLSHVCYHHICKCHWGLNCNLKMRESKFPKLCTQ